MKTYHDPAEVSTHLHILYLDIHFNGYLLPTPYSPKCPFCYGFSTKTLHAFFILHVPPTLSSSLDHKVTPDMIKTMTLLTMQSSSSSMLSSFLGLYIFFSCS